MGNQNSGSLMSEDKTKKVVQEFVRNAVELLTEKFDTHYAAKNPALVGILIQCQTQIYLNDK
jgi:hypothetical protein